MDTDKNHIEKQNNTKDFFISLIFINIIKIL